MPVKKSFIFILFHFKNWSHLEDRKWGILYLSVYVNRVCVCVNSGISSCLLTLYDNLSGLLHGEPPPAGKKALYVYFYF